jgi:hypothetical protein
MPIHHNAPDSLQLDVPASSSRSAKTPMHVRLSLVRTIPLRYMFCINC